MIDRIKSSLAREAILAALKDQSDAARSVRAEARELFESTLEGTRASRDPSTVRGPGEAAASQALIEGIKGVDGLVRSADPDRMAQDLLSGEPRTRRSLDIAQEKNHKSDRARRIRMNRLAESSCGVTIMQCMNDLGRTKRDS